MPLSLSRFFAGIIRSLAVMHLLSERRGSPFSMIQILVVTAGSSGAPCFPTLAFLFPFAEMVDLGGGESDMIAIGSGEGALAADSGGLGDLGDARI
ncbi:hypothetical protein RchiOBHm_Chr4g0399071 [Rosa chinensis]|uniref:Uncharacterized protein n=1 Tax=Rosa chinensis TaxID=74649 RepID=A0A2P6QSH5_ROSCH|nr:hypothetical protein RchiOBHm_Chr4g0399071 [Rosa chinensis]